MLSLLDTAWLIYQRCSMCASQGFLELVIVVLVVVVHIVLLSVLTYSIPHQLARYQRTVLFWGVIGMPLSSYS